MQPSLLETLGVEVGKHLNLAQLLPLRTVCKDWRDTLTLATPRGELDLEPGSPTGADEDGAAAKRAGFYHLCPGLDSLTYHVSPRVCASKFEAAMGELAVHLPGLRHLSLCFNNAAQQLGTRHLAAIVRLPALRTLTIQASFQAEDCDFSVLAGLPRLSELRIIASEGASGLSDSHMTGLAGLAALSVLEFPGAPRAFTGAALDALAQLGRLQQLSVTSAKAGSVGYTLVPACLPAIAALTRRERAAPPLQLELCVPDGGWVPSLMAACSAEGLARLSVTVQAPMSAAQLVALARLPPPAVAKLAGLEAECCGALEAPEVDAIAALTGLERLALSCKCNRAASQRFDLAAWAALARLRSFHLHVNPGWRLPLSEASLATLAHAWPQLQHLHLRLCTADNASHALDALALFPKLRSLSLQWLGEPAALERAGSLNSRRRSSLGDSMAVLDLGCLPPGLESLSATCISQVRIAVPTRGEPGAPSVPALTSLSLDGNFGMSDELLACVTGALPTLRSLALVLAGRQPLTCEGLAAVGSLGDLTALMVADYRDAPLCLHQGCLQGLAGSLRGLRSLKLSTHDIVHHELRPEVFAGFSKLRRLELVGCADQAQEQLADQLPLCCMRPTPDWAEEPVKPAVAAAAAAAAAAAGQAAALLPVAA